jgi:hypothetical protein
MAQDQTPQKSVGTEISGEQVDAVGGGLTCDGKSLVELTENLKQAYDNLVDFTSYVIERVAGTP